MKQDKFMEEVKEIIKADILKKVLPRLIPERDIKQDKSILVHRFLDLGIIYEIKIENVSFVILHEMLEDLNISAEEVQFAAIANMKKQAKIQTMREILSEHFLETEVSPQKESSAEMYVVSAGDDLITGKLSNGAAAILSRSIRKQIVKRMGGNAYLLPSSMLMSEDRVNELEAQGIITDQKEGFTVLYVVFVPEDGVDISIRLTSALLSYYKLKREEIERIAFDQIEKEVVIESVSPKVGKLYGRGYGSSALLCDSIKKEIQERFGEGCCLLPVSVDITIILSNDFAKQTEFLKILAKSISLSIDECNQWKTS